MKDSTNLFWDSCIFIRFLTRSDEGNWNVLNRLLREAKKGERRIFFSTVAFTEIRPRYLKEGGYDSIHQLFADFRGAFEPIDPTPDIYIRAGELRDAKAVNPNPKEPETKRVIGTADAIHLMTCLYVRDVRKISDVVFQTYDDGKGATWEGKCIPLLSFDRWFPISDRTRRVSEVCSLERSTPNASPPRLSVVNTGG